MTQLRIALAQLDVTVGDLSGNADKIVSWTKEAAAQDAHLVAFPEMALTGYPPEDLVLRESFRAASITTIEELARRLKDHGLGEIAVVVGYLNDDAVLIGEQSTAAGPRNAAALLHHGRVTARYYKHHLPNYGVFDEARYFRPGTDFPVIRLHGVDLALTICEDMWQDGGPFSVAGQVDVGLIININGSPYERAKKDVRLRLVQQRAVEANAPICYVNLVGAQDELVFDGGSMVVSATGELIAQSPQFVETLSFVDFELPAASSAKTGEIAGMQVTHHSISEQPMTIANPIAASIAKPLSDEAEVWGALVTGVRDYARKNGFRTITLGLSGGIDSSVCAVISADAMGADRVFGVSMPSGYSSEHSQTDARHLAENIGCHYQVVPIMPMFEAFLREVHLTELAAENLQARIRGNVLMGLSNQNGHLVLATGNKSECAVGFTTIYGDAVGGFAPLKDVPKTLVYRLAQWRNDEAKHHGETPPIPENSITKPPSAELRPGQMDADTLPPYPELDAILADYVDRDLGWQQLTERHDPTTVERVIQMVDRAEYKRRQFPPGPKISHKAFGRDRRLPISSQWKETAPHIS